MPDVSVSIIVPFYNEAEYIERCIQSLLNQDFPAENYEIIFVNNNSTDNSEEIVKKHSKVILLNESIQNNQTPRNTGIKKAKGDILAWTDADCEISSDWISQIVSFINNGADIVLGENLFFSKQSKGLKLIEQFENFKINYIINNMDLKHCYGYSNNMATTKETFNILGFIPEYLNGDTDFIQKCLSKKPDLKMRYNENMRITHLEIKNSLDWFKKVKTYRKYNKALSTYKKPGSLALFDIYCLSVSDNKYPFLSKVRLLSLLFLCELYSRLPIQSILVNKY